MACDSACHQCGEPVADCVLPTDHGPMVAAFLCAPCQGKAWREFVWIKTWAIRLESWGFPARVIGWWWAFWTWRAT